MMVFYLWPYLVSLFVLLLADPKIQEDLVPIVLTPEFEQIQDADLLDGKI